MRVLTDRRRDSGRSRRARCGAGALALVLLALALVSPALAAESRPKFDHLTTGFELLGQHRDLPCESCHVKAMFKGTPKNCSACHGVGTTVRATAKPTSHMLSTDQCDSCHTEISWKLSVTFDHKQALGSCSTCHNGVQAQGKPPNHIVTDLECDACHTTLSWAGATFTHLGVTGNCAECHNNVSAQGMPNNHMPIGSPATPCEACHSPSNFSNWLGAQINHPAVKPMLCASCHETANYLGMHPSTNTTAGDSRPNATLDKNHPTTGDCGVCHDTSTFGAAALRPPNHIPTNAPCAQCHTTTGNYSQYSVTGTHQGVTACLSCHGPTVGPFLDVTIVTAPANHVPIGSLDCNGSGCHTTASVNPGGFKLGTASINAPTLNVAGHTTVAAAVAACQTCHEAAPYLGMLAGTTTAAGDSRPMAALDSTHPATGDCGGCHTTTPTFAGDQTGSAKPANHIPTSAPCAQCHTTVGNFAVYSVTGTHQGVTGCLSCHGSTVNTTFLNVTPVTTPASHIPIGSLECNGSGCHTATNVNPGGFNVGTASINAPTLNVAGHTTVAAAVPPCQTCHEAAPYLGMLAGTATTAGDSRPMAALDSSHPTSGDCGSCHSTTPTFANDQSGNPKPANHIPTSAPCAQCHTTAGNYALYSVTGTHQGVTGCLSCHGSTVNTTFDIPIVTTVASHIPIGTLDCNGSGCHSTTNVNAGGFNIGTANISSPTLTITGHTTVAAGVSGCQTCHETAPYVGMLASTSTTAGDSRPTALDKNHPTTGDCGGCHTTTPTLTSDVTQSAKPANHIPTTAPCAQCHTNASNYALYSVTGTHQGVTDCLSCHGPAVASTFVNVTIVTTPANHFPIGTLDCNGSGCHGTSNVNPGGFKLGTANTSSPTLTVAGHTTVAAAVAGCQTCHETAPYLGMLAGTTAMAGDSRPSTTLDAAHPTTGDCGSCHTTTPTFAVDQSGNTKPANHIPTSAPCAQCHTTVGNYTVYSVTGTHQGVTGCSSCHGPTVATTFANVTIVSTPSNHFPIGTVDCNGSGCHSTSNVNAGGFNIGTANVSSPTLTIAGHTTVAAGVSGCQTCHETAPYLGMLASGATAGDSRPSTTLDSIHPTTGDCGGCHTTTPTFAVDQTGNAKPANHIPTTAPCGQCHTTAGNYTVYSVTGVHQGVTACLSCHGPTVAATFVNVTIVTTPGNHFPIATLDCNGSGCHSTSNVNPGGFNLGTANISSPTLSVTGHTTVAAGVSGGCQTCHETAPYIGMLASTSSTAGDSRPTALDKLHPTTGDCTGCHTTTPTFGNDMTAGSKPANHIPTNAPCAQCHTTAGNYALYSVTATHQGVTGCVSCHGPAVATTFANITIVTTPSNHFPIGTVDCNGSGCHSTSNVNAGGFNLGTANTSSPVLSVAGHTTVAAGVAACASCHESAAYLGMLPSTSTAAADSRPTALDKNHPTSGDCGSCHVTTPMFATNLLPTVPKPTNHIPTAAVCAQCHTTAGSYALYSVTGTHAGVTGCLSCHGTTVATTFANITIVTTPGNHFPIGTLDCNGSGCHGTTNVNPGGFNIGTANISSPTLSIAGHTTVAAGVSGCQTCHETASYIGMLTSTSTVAGDSRPTAMDKNHPASGDCGGCHTTTPTFAGDITAAAKPANHIPTSAPCTQCHTTTNNYALYSVTATHQGVTGCLSCHGATVGPFANVTVVTLPSNHFPIGALDCNGSGCHSTANVNPGGFNLGTANISNPTLTIAGHATVVAGVGSCQTCHETASYLGMLASSATAAGDSRPTTTLDAGHPTSGDCNGCHTTTPTFATDQTGTSKPANHIPTSASCGQCHTTAGNYTLYSVTGTHQGVTGCLTCHGPTVATTFANVTMVTTPSNHFPIGTVDCNGSGCHSTLDVNPGGFKLGAANISSPTLSVTGHTTVTAGVGSCQTCHETAPYMGMLASSATAAGDSRPSTTLDNIHPTTGDCGGCHMTTPTFAVNQTGNAKPANHIPTTAPCAQCHTTTGNYTVYSVTGVHQGVTACVSCHGPTVATTFVNISIVTTPGNHFPIGTVDCNGSGCHSTLDVNPGGFKLGTANISSPTLSVTGHTTVAAGVSGGCQTCHETAPYLGMIASSATVAGDSRPAATLDKNHPTTGDCGGCHTTTPTFTVDQTGSTKPANHIPTSAPCAQCHTTPGNNALYSVTGVHQGVTGCLTCHGPTVATTFANVTIVSTPGNHFPIGTVDCNGSGCHSTTNVNPGGFNIGTANISSPTLTIAGHTTVAAGVSGCQTCHETAPYLGMLVSGATAAGDSRPSTTLDKIHPTTGECGGCHTTTPTFAVDQTGNAKPANHIPTTAPCAQCHTTAGNYTVYSVTGTHQGVTGCASCHGPTVANTFANISIVTTPGNHFPIGTVDCNGSGCHSTTNVNPGGFNVGTANISSPTLTIAGHTTVAAGVSGCQSCHETAPYMGMLASTATTASDSRPTAFDKNHPTSGDCNGCHTTTPTFAVDQSGNTKPTNHIPTSAPCAQCHTTSGNDAVYSVTGVHQGVTGCLTCHGPTVATTFANVTIVTTPNNHIPIGTLDCNGSGCHTTTNVNAGGFHLGAANLSTPTLTVAGHATVNAVAACQTCHETAPYLGMIASTATAAGDSRPTAFDAGHPTTGDCGGCHTTTPTFSTNQSGASAKPANHIPTNASCAQCHTTAGNYAVYTMGATGHTGITSNCAQCHAYGMSFYNMAPPTLKEPASGATGHIPAVPPNGTKTIACELCHSPTAFTTYSGTVMKHAYVTSMTCMSCHEYGMTWQTNAGVQLWTRPSPSHHAGQDCGGSGCHTSRDKYVTRTTTARQTTPATAAARIPAGVAPAGASTSAAAPSPGAARPARETGPAAGATGAPFNHPSAAATACSSCHSGASSGGKPAGHIASSNACQSCHTTLGWLPVTRVDHTQVVGTCASCHNGTIARGKPSSHLPATAACERCHTTIAWTPAHFDHAAVTPHSCSTCHNAVHAIGLPRAHIPTTQPCDTCHGTLAWSPVKIDHAHLTASCVSCHNNVGAVGLSPGHLRTPIDCARCHSYPDWSEVNFRHTSSAYPAGRHVKIACTSCHTTETDKVPYPSPANAGTCAGCHAKDFKPAAHAKTKGLTYAASELADCTGACHVYSDVTQSTVIKRMPGPYHRVSDGAFSH